jgi:hypothetical protein
MYYINVSNTDAKSKDLDSCYVGTKTVLYNKGNII